MFKQNTISHSSDKMLEQDVSKIIPASFTEDYISDIGNLIEHSRGYIESRINTTIVYTYWLIGKRIRIQEQNGDNRAEYGKEV